MAIALFAAVLASVPARAQAGTAKPANTTPAGTSDEDVEATRDQLFHLLRLTPRLTSVVARDPSLLADDAYVARANPELSAFLKQHAEVARNPEFYLFAQLNSGRPGVNREQRLEATIWPEYQRNDDPWAGDMIAFLVFIVIVVTLAWLLRMFLDNRRWTRVHKTQTDMYNKLLDKFGTSEELLQYMRTDPGKRFFETAPVTLEFEHDARWSMPMARVMRPLQFGIVLAATGIGMMELHLPGAEHVGRAAEAIGAVALAAGIGFIISAMVSWAIAHRYGLVQRPADHADQARTLGASDRAPLA